MIEGLDGRLVAARGDIAADHLRGRVTAERFVPGTDYQVTAGVVAVRKAPEDDAEMLSQGLHGETFTIYDERDGHGWGQCQQDGYVGWVDMAALSLGPQPTPHRIAALRTYVFSEPNIKSAPHYLITENARVHIEDRQGDLVRLARAGWVAARHVVPMGTVAEDFVAEVRKYVGTPYLWGGRESLGLDCSGLVMAGMLACGVPCPRDSDMQRKWLGQSIGGPFEAPRFEPGDIVCWRGHVGVVGPLADTLIHANAHWMATVEEPLTEALARIAAATGPVLDVRRVELARDRTAPTPWRGGLR